MKQVLLSPIRLALVGLISLFASNSFAQQTIFTTEAVHIDPSANVAFFGDMDMRGTMSSYKGASTQPVVYFLGTNWTNNTSTTSLRPNPTTDAGAEYIFQGSAAQTLYGGSIYLDDENSYFPNLTINNSNDVNLASHHEGTSGTVKFTAGHFKLNRFNFTVGNSTQGGTISSFDQNKYFVTNGTSTADTSGFLIRFSDFTNVDYPVGQSTTKYNPARILMTAGSSQRFKVRVFDSTFQGAYSTTTDASNESSGETWMIELTGVAPIVDITLDNVIANEGSLYSTNRAYGYIAHYYGTAPNTAGGVLSNTLWDRISGGSSGVSGTITTGAAMATHAEHIRTGVDKFSPFAKSFNNSFTPLPIQLISFTATKQEPNVKVNWQVAQEREIEKYEVERASSADFIDVVSLGQILPANTSDVHGYDLLDEHPLAGYGYYRLKVYESKGGEPSYSDIKVVFFDGPSAGTVTNFATLYPNPIRPGESFMVKVSNSDKPVDIRIYNIQGAILRTIENASSQSAIEVSQQELSAGLYMVEVTDAATKNHLSLLKLNVQR